MAGKQQQDISQDTKENMFCWTYHYLSFVLLDKPICNFSFDNKEEPKMTPCYFFTELVLVLTSVYHVLTITLWSLKFSTAPK